MSLAIFKVTKSLKKTGILFYPECESVVFCSSNFKGEDGAFYVVESIILCGACIDIIVYCFSFS